MTRVDTEYESSKTNNFMKGCEKIILIQSSQFELF